MRERVGSFRRAGIVALDVLGVGLDAEGGIGVRFNK